MLDIKNKQMTFMIIIAKKKIMGYKNKRHLNS